MRRFLFFCLMASFAGPAWTLPVAVTLAQWQSLRDQDAPGIAFTDGYTFLTQHPDWPDSKIIRLRTEAAALFEQQTSAPMQSFCAEFPPLSGRGMIACYRAQAGDPELRGQWLHQGWIRGDFSESEERTIFNAYKLELTHTDNVMRLERLLYEHKIPAVKRLLTQLPRLNQPYYRAWLASVQNDRQATAMISALPANQQHAPGFLFERLNAAIDAHRFDQVVALARSVPANAPYPEIWWPGRNIAIREALAKRDHATALSLLGNRGKLKGEALAEALWLKGWITFTFRRNAPEAYKEFRALYTEVNTPVSRARAAYWAARAAAKNGNPEIAQEWYEKAAQYPTVFYGQLAQHALTPDEPLSLPATPAATADDIRAFEADERVQATRLLAQDPDTTLRDKFLANLALTADSPTELALAAKLARDLGGLSSGVKVAKLVLRQRVMLIEAGWPQIPLPPQLGVEPALALAISRQESEFNPRAQSNANAYGLMQLLPATAKHVAERNDWQYDPRMLVSPKENLTLGSAYLGQIIQGFDRSYVLGIASYNAGPATVRHWIDLMGPPPKNPEGMVNWIESIPYSETRNYVMRVLENLTIYRTLLAPDAPPTLTRDLSR